VFDIAALAVASQILPAHDVFRLHRVQRPDHLQLFVAHRVRVKVIGRLHRDQAQQLHHMVLHHIAHRARLVIIRPAPVHRHGFRHGDLHMVDIFGLPQRFEQDVGKAHRHQVLHGFLAQIMVDPVNLRFGEMLGQHRIQRTRRDQIASERLFHHDPAPGIGNAVQVQPFGNIAKQAGRDREIKRPHHIFPHQPGQLAPAALAGGVDRDIGNLFKKLRHHRRILTVLWHEFANRIRHQRAERFVGQISPRRADDAAVFGHLPRQKAPIKAGKNLSLGQIAGAAKDHQIKGINRNNTRNHGLPRSLSRNSEALLALTMRFYRHVDGKSSTRCSLTETRAAWQHIPDHRRPSTELRYYPVLPQAAIAGFARFLAAAPSPRDIKPL